MTVRFGRGVELDVDRVELLVEGAPVAIEPQVFDVLAYLVSHRDRLVTKEELLDNIWGDRFVSESALTSRIKSARQAVGDNGRDQTVIRTVHGRGYRFIAPVLDTSPDRAGQPNGGGPVVPVVEVESVPPTDGGSERGALATAGGSATEATRSPIAAPPAVAPDRATDTEPWPLVGRHDELAELGRLFHEPTCGGILLTGPTGIGKTRLAHEGLRLAERAGWPTATVHGHAEAGTIPLASVAHLLPDDILDVPAGDTDMARAVVFRRAREALEALGGGRRLVLLVDNIDQVDELSAAIIGSVVGSGTVFALLTQRVEEGDALAMEDLVRAERIAHLPLEPLDDTDLDVLLYRVLAGPIDVASLDRLTAASGGRPGALHELVQSCLSRRVLERQSDVWRVVGTLEPRVGREGVGALSLDDLEPSVRRAAELLAVAEDLGLEVATTLLGADALDELDRLGLLAVRDDDGQLRVSLAQAHVAALLVGSLGQLRSRRHKTELLEALARASSTEHDRLRVVRWSIETGTPVDPQEVLAAGRFAVATRDGPAAEVLIDHLATTHPSEDLVQVRAELCYRRGQMGAAEELLDSLDLDRLAPRDAAVATRRQATILFHVRGRFEEALELLAERSPRFGPEAEGMLRAHWVSLQSFYGRSREVIEHGERLLPTLDGRAALEVLRSVGQAHLLHGTIDRALEYLEEHARRAAALPRGVARPGRETAMAATITCHIEHGSVHQALDLVRRHLPVGRRTMLAWLPLAAARAELAAGRPRGARELISTPLAAVRTQNLLHAAPLMTAVLAQSYAHAGDHERARREAGDLLATVDELDGQLRFSLVLALADVWEVLGEPDRVLPVVRAAADRARELDTATSEARLLAAAAALGDPAQVADRLEEVAGRIDGPFWTVRARHVRALAGGKGPDPDLENEYRRMGHVRLADRVRDGR